MFTKIGLARFLAVLALLAGVAVVAAPVSSMSGQSEAAAYLTATPTAAVTPTPTSSPTATPGAAPATDPAMDAWCLPKGSVITSADLEKTVKPANAIPMKLAANGTPMIKTIVDACIFTFTFSKAAPADLTLEVYDALNRRWLSAVLKPSDKPEMVFATLRHSYIVDPPYWAVDYTLKVVDPAGAEKWGSKVTFSRGYEPGKCYDGSWPDPVTWYCYYPPDAHPWDSWYKFENPRP